MGTLKFKYTHISGDAPDAYHLSKSNFRKFTVSLLGLGDLAQVKESFEGLAVIFDLKGFTSFCDQRDPHLEVPTFLNDFLCWLFGSISKESVREEDGNQMLLWNHLPFYAKFLGDGTLFLWEARSLAREAKWNIVSSLYIICNDYEKEFLPMIRKKFTNPPPKLRCGIAQGQIPPIGNENDFAGLCINLASRLQKLEEGRFSFAFTSKGLDMERAFQEDWLKDFRMIRVPIPQCGQRRISLCTEERVQCVSCA